VVHKNLSPITTKVAWQRVLYFLGPSYLGSMLMPVVALGPHLAVLALVYLIGLAGGLYVLVDVIVGLADTQQQRTLHDRFTRTRVIREPA
jgi:hypothetical protein